MGGAGGRGRTVRLAPLDHDSVQLAHVDPAHPERRM